MSVEPSQEPAAPRPARPAVAAALAPLLLMVPVGCVLAIVTLKFPRVPAWALALGLLAVAFLVSKGRKT